MEALDLEEQMKWKMMFCGHEECCRTESIAAIEPLMYVVSRVIATCTPSSEHMYVSSIVLLSSSSLLLLTSSLLLIMEAQFGEL